MPRLKSVVTLVLSLVALAMSVAVAIRIPGRHELYGDEGRPEVVGSDQVVSER